MQITQITVNYGYTHGLPNYSSVRSDVSLTATLHEGDDPEQVRRELWLEAESQVQQMVDAALVEQHRMPPFFDKERRRQMFEEAMAKAEAKRAEAEAAQKKAQEEDEVAF